MLSPRNFKPIGISIVIYRVYAYRNVYKSEAVYFCGGFFIREFLWQPLRVYFKAFFFHIKSLATFSFLQIISLSLLNSVLDWLRLLPVSLIPALCHTCNLLPDHVLNQQIYAMIHHIVHTTCNYICINCTWTSYMLQVYINTYRSVVELKKFIWDLGGLNKIDDHQNTSLTWMCFINKLKKNEQLICFVLFI